MKKLVVDLGSRTVKPYIVTENRVIRLAPQTFPLKEGFDPTIGISGVYEEKILALLTTLKEEYTPESVVVYATSLFRDMVPVVQEAYQNKLQSLGMSFVIVGPEEENYYHQMTFQDCYMGKYLLVSIGGGSTELALFEHNKVVATHNVALGVGDILKRYSGINQEYASPSLQEIAEEIKKALPEWKVEPDFAIYPGGELRYMKVTKYPLTIQPFFEDARQPLGISLQDYCQYNETIFSQITINELREKMPENPEWMMGARACSALAQAIFTCYKVPYVIPSDLNMMDGILKHERSFPTT